MKKSYIVWLVVVIIIIVGAVGIYMAHNGANSGGSSMTGSSTSPLSATQTTQLSSSLSKFENQELGFSVQYPSDWQAESAPAGVTFIIPDQFPETTIGTLDAVIQVLPGECAFPPVTTIQSQGTMTSGSMTFDTISIQNSVEGRGYFDRMYSLQKGTTCYMFTLESVTVNPTTKGFSASDTPKISANNQSHISDADAAFKAVVQSFAFVAQPTGEPETSYHAAATSTTK